jgi:glycolate oxidase FAD binding subunit
VPGVQLRVDGAVNATVARVAPADAAEVGYVLGDASRARRTVRITGGGTKRYVGDGRSADLEIATAHLSGVVDHVPADLTVTIGAGTRIADLGTTLGRAGQFLPLDPPHADAATVGGVIAANANGFWRARYGAVRDLLIGTRAALADGSVVRAGGRVVKNVAGYDLNKLFVGSFGTLGVIVEATFRVLPVPEASSGVVARFRRAGDAFAAADALVRGAARPAALVIDHGAHTWTLHVAARGDRPTVERIIADARTVTRGNGGAIEPEEDGLADLRELPARATDGALVRAVVPLAAQGPFADTAARLGTIAAVVVDAASGTVRVHLRGEDDGCIRDAEALLLAARAVGGSGRVERRSEHLRERLRAWPTPPSGAFLMRRVKERFDPEGILEPGRSAIG